jgi:hypothetical protein
VRLAGKLKEFKHSKEDAYAKENMDYRADGTGVFVVGAVGFICCVSRERRYG